MNGGTICDHLRNGFTPHLICLRGYRPALEGLLLVLLCGSLGQACHILLFFSSRYTARLPLGVEVLLVEGGAFELPVPGHGLPLGQDRPKETWSENLGVCEFARVFGTLEFDKRHEGEPSCLNPQIPGIVIEQISRPTCSLSRVPPQLRLDRNSESNPARGTRGARRAVVSTMSSVG